MRDSEGEHHGTAEGLCGDRPRFEDGYQLDLSGAQAFASFGEGLKEESFVRGTLAHSWCSTWVFLPSVKRAKNALDLVDNVDASEEV